MDDIRITVEDLRTDRKYGTLTSRSCDPSDVAEAVRRTILRIQGCDFLATKALMED